MKHIILDEQEESIKSFVLSLALNAEVTLLELEGRPLAFFSPSPQAGPKKKKEEWTSRKNQRRCDLIDLEIEGTLTVEQALELRDLQREMLDYRRKVAPLPLDAARTLHKRLLNKTNRRETQE